MRKRINAIYKATNTIDNKCYIGQTTFTLASRKASHKRKALILRNPAPFYDAIREHGFDVFKWEIVCTCKNKEELDDKEREVIKTFGIDNCYNSYTGGISGFEISDRTRKILSEQKKGKLNPQYGKKLSEEAKTNLLKASMEVCEKRVGKLGNGEKVVEEYKSMSECARVNKCSVSAVSMHVNGKMKTQRYVLI